MRTILLVLLSAVGLGLSMPSGASALPINSGLLGIAGAVGVAPEPVVVCRSVRQRVCSRGVCRTRVVRRCV